MITDINIEKLAELINERDKLRADLAALRDANSLLGQEVTTLQTKLATESQARLEVVRENEALKAELGAAKKDTERLDWLLNYIFLHGTEGVANLPWTVKEANGEDSDIRFDRAAIDAARQAKAALGGEVGT